MFADRVDAGRRLAGLLLHLAHVDPVVMGLTRGGVVVAAEVARMLAAPLDLMAAHRPTVPLHPESARGAIRERGGRLVRMKQPEQVPGAGGARIDLNGRVVLIVDDGIVTGSTALTACRTARVEGAAEVVVAAPVASREAVEALARAADEVVVVEIPEPFTTIADSYANFTEPTDEQVISLIESWPTPLPTGSDPLPHVGGIDREVEVAAGTVILPGRLTVPESAIGVVMFAHGSGSSRHSPRNRFVAREMNAARIATLLFDLLTPSEEGDRANVFDIELIGRRLTEATRRLTETPDVAGLPLGYFGASTGAAAALWAAAELGEVIRAVVSRGGRPDLASDRLGDVRSPTLLLVGGDDRAVLALNRDALGRLGAFGRLEIVAGAGHLFEEPGALEAAAALAVGWFRKHLGAEGTFRSSPR